MSHEENRLIPVWGTADKDEWTKRMYSRWESEGRWRVLVWKSSKLKPERKDAPMKSTATCTVWLEDGTEHKHVNVTYSRWERNNRTFVVQRYDPADENRLQTFVYKRKNIKQTLREQDYTEDIDLTDRPAKQPYLDDPKPTSVQIKESALVKFYIVHSARPDLAWNGSRWVPHIGGYQSSAEKTCGFETRKEAEAYAKGHFPGAALK